MKKSVLLIVSIFFLAAGVCSAQPTLKARLENHLYTLANDSLRGRRAGSDDGLKAAEYIAAQFRLADIVPYSESSYFQQFNRRNVLGQAVFHNVVGIIPGSDPALRDEYIVVGAHYDHVGVEQQDGVAEIYNGADDNASGVAALIEMGRSLKAREGELARSVILVAFDAEEIGLYGSQYFVDYPIVPIENIKLMISVDMVGWYGANKAVEYLGTATFKNGKDYVLASGLVPQGLTVAAENFEYIPGVATDTAPFAVKGIPTIHVTTGLVSPYHKPEDTADLIDYDGLALITEHLANVVSNSARNVPVEASGRVASKHRSHEKKIAFSMTLNIGANNHFYTAGAVNGKSRTSFGIGAGAQVLLYRSLAMRTELYYERIGARHPDGRMWMDAATIPLSLVVKNSDTSIVGVDISLGGYYSYKFNGRQAHRKMDFADKYYRNEGGLTWGFGMRINKVRMGYTARYALTDMARSRNSEGAGIRNHASYFTVSYIF